MPSQTQTQDQGELERRDARSAEPVPGLLLIFSAGEPLHGCLPLHRGALELGRGGIPGVRLDDGLMSRQHARVRFDGTRWHVADLGSRNGTAVDGQALTGEAAFDAPRVIRTGGTLLLPVPDLRPWIEGRVEVQGDQVMGPGLRALHEQIRRSAPGGALHITGESGAGKELAARAFHRFGPHPEGPFVAVNCAAIPEGVAERLLFGARKGAFSGAVADADGYVQSAHGGTLFLDEVGELDLSVQAKLLRVLETHEVLPLGASKPRAVDVRVVSATHRDLRDLVAAKRFRADLFFRLGRPHVALPSLRERLEEIPVLIDRTVRRVSERLVPHVSLVESCLLRVWPGNVRELVVEVREAAETALAAGDTAVKLSHLASDAGQGFGEGAPAEGEAAASMASAGLPDRETIEAALRRCGGRVASAARELKVHRNQLRRWLARHEVDPQAFAPAGSTRGDPDGEG